MPYIILVGVKDSYQMTDYVHANPNIGTHFSHKRASPKHELNKKAQAVWRAYVKKPEAVDFAWEIYQWYFPGCIPEPFKSSGGSRTRLAYDLLRGDVGQLRVRVGEPLELRRINYSAVKGLAGLAEDIFAQYEAGLVAEAFTALKTHVRGPFWAVIERGRKNGENHFHLLTQKGSCGLGVSNGVILDADLPNRLAYFCKAPEWQPETVVGYLTVKQAYPNKKVARRYKAAGLGSFRFTEKQIQETTGLILTRPLVEYDAKTNVLASEPQSNTNVSFMREATT
jgi:hypothetical protein